MVIYIKKLKKIDNVFKLLDGDKIAGLAAMFIMELVQDAGIDTLKVGVVQTAYANGSSTDYLTNVLVSTMVFFIFTRGNEVRSYYAKFYLLFTRMFVYSFVIINRKYPYLV